MSDTVLHSGPTPFVSTSDPSILEYLRSLPGPGAFPAGKTGAWSQEQPGTGHFEVSQHALDAVRRMLDGDRPLVPLYG